MILKVKSRDLATSLRGKAAWPMLKLQTEICGETNNLNMLQVFI